MLPKGTSSVAVQWRSSPASVKHGKVVLEAYEAFKICVEAANQNTIAFDGVKGWLIVTNIFCSHVCIMVYSSCLESRH